MYCSYQVQECSKNDLHSLLPQCKCFLISYGRCSFHGILLYYLNGIKVLVLAYFHWRRRTKVPTRTLIPNPMVALYYAEHVHIAQTRIPTPYFCTWHRSESVPEFVSGTVNEPLVDTIFFRKIKQRNINYVSVKLRLSKCINVHSCELYFRRKVQRWNED